VSESIPQFVHPDRSWRLSGHDVEIIEDLKEVIRWWLPAVTDTEDLAAAVAMLRNLDAVVSGISPKVPCEFTVSRIDPKEGGISVSIITSTDRISLSCEEWVPSVNGTLDHGTIVDRDGRLLSMNLGQMGSYDRELFDRWWRHAIETGPQGPRDQNVKGTVSVEK
jgi:hypothetical protein